LSSFFYAVFSKIFEVQKENHILQQFVNQHLTDYEQKLIKKPILILNLKNMKKIILIFVVAVTFGISASTVNATNKEDKKKETKKEVTTSACCSAKSGTAEKTATTGCSEAQKKSCVASAKTCGADTEKKAEKK